MFAPLKQQFLLTSSTTSQQSHTAVIDTLGHDFVSVGLHASTVAETSPEITMKIQEGDTTSSYSDVEAFKGGTSVVEGSTGFVIPSGPTATGLPSVVQFDIDTRHRKRYLLLTVTPFTTKTLISWFTAGKPEQGPLSAANDNLVKRVSG